MFGDNLFLRFGDDFRLELDSGSMGVDRVTTIVRDVVGVVMSKGFEMTIWHRRGKQLGTSTTIRTEADVWDLSNVIWTRWTTSEVVTVPPYRR